MKAKILTFSSHGDTTLLEYDPATADMDEVNRVIAEYSLDGSSHRRRLMVRPGATDTTPVGSVRLRKHPG